MPKRLSIVPSLLRNRLIGSALDHELWVAHLVEEPKGLLLPDDFYEDHFALRQEGRFIGVRAPVRPGSHDYVLSRNASQDLHDVLFARNDLGIVCDAVHAGTKRHPVRIGFGGEVFEDELHFTTKRNGPVAHFSFRPATAADLLTYDGHRVAVRSANGTVASIGRHP